MALSPPHSLILLFCSQQLFAKQAAMNKTFPLELLGGVNHGWVSSFYSSKVFCGPDLLAKLTRGTPSQRIARF